MNIKARRKARKLLLQALYQWMMSQQALTDIEAQFKTDNDMSQVDEAYFSQAFHAIPHSIDQLDQTFEPFLNLELAQLNPIELISLRIGTYELTQQADIPYKVAINEAVELTKAFGTVEGYKFVNGVLDKVARQLHCDDNE